VTELSSLLGWRGNDPRSVEQEKVLFELPGDGVAPGQNPKQVPQSIDEPAAS
jgi:hypothetical protein